MSPIKSHHVICHHLLWLIPQLRTSWKTWKLQAKQKCPASCKFQWVHPNVNWSILQKLTSNRHDLFNTTMLFLGSFGLHVINGALKTGHVTVKWKAQLLLRLF